MQKSGQTKKSVALTRIALVFGNIFFIILFFEMQVIAKPFMGLFKDLGEHPAITTLTILNYVSIIGLITLILFTIGWFIIIRKNKGEKYILKDSQATGLIIISSALIFVSIPLLLLLLYTPMFDIVSLIKE